MRPLGKYRPWGHAPASPPAAVLPVVWRSEPLAIARLPTTVLPFACGRSYGDSCLNPGGVVLDVAALDRFIAFDPEAGMLRCEAGVTLSEILAVAVPQGWFLPVVPGTQHVSVGGATVMTEPSPVNLTVSPVSSAVPSTKPGFAASCAARNDALERIDTSPPPTSRSASAATTG